MELVVIEKNAYLRLKQQVEDLFTQIELLKRKNEWMPRRFAWL